MSRLTSTKAILCALVGFCALPNNAAAQAASGYDWSGLYIAATYGGDSADLSGRFYQPDTGFTSPSNLDNVTNGAFGAAAGYNLQMGRLVLGVEGRWSGTSISKSKDLDFGSYRQHRTIEDTVMIGARVGAAFSRLHAYGTAGVASAGSRILTRKISLVDDPALTVSDKDERIYGTYIGAGLEWAVTSKLALGLEYDRTRLNEDKVSWLDDAGNNTILDNDELAIDTIQARVLFKF